MAVALVIFIVIAVFEARKLIKDKTKKETVLYIAIAALAVALGVYLLLVPGFTSFSKAVLDFFGAAMREGQ